MRLLLFLALALSSITLWAQPTLAFQTLATGLTQPTDVTGAGDGSGRLFITEKTGRIKIFDLNTNTVLPTNFLNLSGQIRTNSERGVLGIAFHPDFANNGEFFVNYVSNGVGAPSSGQTVVSRFTLNNPADNVTLLSSEEIIITISQPFSNHNAGDLAFGPDGMLYIPTGDGGSGGDPNDTGQDPNSLLGKMLRIDVDSDPSLPYTIPADNPFIGDPTVRDEIWALGLRNPWRISFDRVTGDLWIGDVGQGLREEVNFQAAGSAGGQNYGWDCREGLIGYNGPPGGPAAACTAGSVYTDPIFDYDHSSNLGGLSLTGGFVYRGQQADDLLGWYVCADFVFGRFFLLPPGDDGSGLVRQNVSFTDITTFGEDDEGNLYLANFDGALMRITTELSLPVTLSSWSARLQEKSVLLRWSTTAEEQSDYFLLERSSDGANFSEIARVPASGRADSYSYTDQDLSPGTYFYRLTQTDLDGTQARFDIRQVSLLEGRQGWPTISPNPAEQDVVVRIPELQERGKVALQIFAADGRLVFSQEAVLDAGPQQLNVTLPKVPAGFYHASVTYDNEAFTLPLSIR